jgi:hypothetical protein
MRKKAEKRIRQAAAELGEKNLYRIDQIRERAGLIKKVFDKTILDMARLGTIELRYGETHDMFPHEIENLLRYRDSIFVYLCFSDGSVDRERE